MEILTVLNDLYHVNPEEEEKVREQIALNLPYLFFKDGRKSIILAVQNIVSIELYDELYKELKNESI